MAELENLFETQIYRAALGGDGAARLNKDLRTACLSIAHDDRAGQKWSREHNYRGYTSYASLNDLAYRVPAFLRWPGHVHAGSICNEIVSHLDWLPTLLAAAGEPDIKAKLLKGHQVGKKNFKVHLDGYNMIPLFLGKEKKSPRQEFFYFNDDGDMVALRFDNFKVVFMEQRCPGTCQIWAEPFVVLRVPKIFNLRTDPYEMADITSNTYWDWMFDHIFVVIPAQAKVAQFMESFKEFPPRQRAASFSVDQVMDKIKCSLESRSL